MTTQGIAVQAETLSQRVARRLRGALAENRIAQTDLAKALHLPQQNVSRRILGQTPFTLDELELLAQVLGVPLDAVLGVGDFAERSIGLCAIRDSNPEPADSTPRGRLLSIVGRIPLGDPLPARRQPETRPQLRLVGGAA